MCRLEPIVAFPLATPPTDSARGTPRPARRPGRTPPKDPSQQTRWALFSPESVPWARRRTYPHPVCADMQGRARCVAHIGFRCHEVSGVLRDLQETPGCVTHAFCSIRHICRQTRRFIIYRTMYWLHTPEFPPREPSRRNTPVPSLQGCATSPPVCAARQRRRVHTRAQFAQTCKVAPDVLRISGSGAALHQLHDAH